MNNWRYMTDRNFSKGRKYIGASDMPTITGINPYKTPMQLWEELTGRAKPFTGNSRTAWGHRMEPQILGEYILRTTGSYEDRNGFITSRLWDENRYKDFYSWTESFAGDRLVSHADLLDLSGETPVIVQAKNTGAYAADARRRDQNKGYSKEDLTANGVPLSVYFQEQWELYTYGVETAYVAVLIDGWDWKLYGPVVYDKKVIEKLLALAQRMLWHVDNDTPPTPKTWGDIVKLYPDFKPNTKAVVSDDAELECRQMIDEYGKITQKIKALEDRKNDIKNALGLYIGGNNYLETSEGSQLASVSVMSGRETVSLSDVRKYPDIYKQLENAGLIKKSDGYRSLFIKGAPAGNITKYTLLTTDDGQTWKRSRKKYSKEEKKITESVLKSQKILHKWEVYK